MTTWKIEPCSVKDAAALARNNMAAFWEDPNWITLWPKDMKREFIIEQSAKRQPRNLLRDREKVRHQKAVDPILPPGHRTAENGSPAWAEAQVPDVSEDEKKRYQELAESAWWSPREDMDSLDDKNHVVMDRILAEKPYIRLDYLAVHPENKGKGIGTALVANGIKHAEHARVPIFTLAFKAGRGVYARLGFQEVDRIIQDDSKYGGPGEYAAYFMIYDVPGDV
ncbi:acyl-CoA N-acyltransferase [Aspergillus caelatus]|uniref:Acyl-CoA N-acyltransferase n=1 Tax=Aspergillus caelatus TaxID=61420 RepID=A0A5N7AMA3_9EURO|nr:acyl-CoA N-acyltransferase [Aspergillus caelatus]KAE8369830.1 acyl-CoA N-acyltransferase [Aspergillus caelatus]